MNDLPEAPRLFQAHLQPPALPVIFINREGEPEQGCQPLPTLLEECPERPRYVHAGDVQAAPRSARLPLSTAMNRLHRALFETGQLIVTTHDGLVRVCFAGVGDPERLLVEALPRDVPVPSIDGGYPGSLCSLPHAEALLRRIYRGERGSRVEATLQHLSSVQARRGRARGTADALNIAA